MPLYSYLFKGTLLWTCFTFDGPLMDNAILKGKLTLFLLRQIACNKFSSTHENCCSYKKVTWQPCCAELLHEVGKLLLNAIITDEPLNHRENCRQAEIIMTAMILKSYLSMVITYNCRNFWLFLYIYRFLFV